MKAAKIALLSGLMIGSLQATTVSATGGIGGAQFFTSLGTGLTSANSTFLTGIWDGTTFTQFAPNDASQIAISGVPVLANRWSGNAADTSLEASAFDNQQIWFQVSTTADGGGTAYLSGTNTFPPNGQGVGDSINYNSTDLSVLGAGSTDGSRAYDAADGRVIIGVVPEPSVALLGVLGMLGLVRRRR